MHLKIYGVSQNPDTGDYIIIFNYENNEYYKEYSAEICCLKCRNIYTYIEYKWCKPCTINSLEKNFTNWVREDEKIFNLIQKMRSRIVYPTDIVFEWIPYNQFNNIKVIYKDYLYLATWEDGPLLYDSNKYIRKSKRVVLKYLNSSQNMTDFNEILNNDKV
jgi:hypothetical protein